MMALRVAGLICDRRQLTTQPASAPPVLEVAEGLRFDISPTWFSDLHWSSCSVIGETESIVVEVASPRELRVNGEPLEALQQRLHAGDHFEIEGLLFFVHGAAPPEPSEHLCVWLERLASGDDDARWTAAQALGTWAPGVPEVRVAFDVACDDAWAPVRRYAERGLHHAQPRSFYLRATSELIDATRYGAVEIRLGEERQLGRHLHNDVVVRSPTLSQRHAIARNLEARWEVEDLRSTSGTLVNGRFARPGEPLPIIAGDTIRVGGVTFEVTASPRSPLLP